MLVALFGAFCLIPDSASDAELGTDESEYEVVIGDGDSYYVKSGGNGTVIGYNGSANGGSSRVMSTSMDNVLNILDNGSLIDSTGMREYAAVPDDGYAFDYWQNGSTKYYPGDSITPVKDQEYTAYFKQWTSPEVEYGPDSYYKYVINYINERIISVDLYTEKNGTPISFNTSNSSIWAFNEDGYGPFNSCYAAVDSTGTIAFHLNPNNLKQKLGGASYTTSDYNIVWLIPTVYWSSDGYEQGTLTLSNDPTEGTAYAHTIGGSVREYIGIGVYEASTATFGGVANSLMSQTGKTPTVHQDITIIDTYAHNTPGNTMLWNFYQWTLTKMATYTVGMGKNSQQIFGAGLTSGGTVAATTGLGDSAGAIVTGQTSYSKVFIENSWGSVSEWVGDTVFSSKVLYAGQNASGVTYTGTTGKTAGGTLPSSNWISGTYKDAAYWDLPKSSFSSNVGSNTSYPGDRLSSNSGTRVLNVGGACGNGEFAGVAYLYAYVSHTYTGAGYGARLAYFFSEDPAAITTVTVTYKNGSSVLQTEQVQKNGTITYLNPNVTGKIFCGWYNDSGLTSAFANSTSITADKTLWGYFVDPLRFTTSPVASATITYSASMGAILFDAVKSESAYKVLWDFGDGFTSDLKSIYHSYAEPGTYSVKLSVYNFNDEVDVKEYTVTVTDSGFSEGKPDDNTLKMAVAGIAIAVTAVFVIARPF